MGKYKDPEYQKKWYDKKKTDPEFQLKRKCYRELHKKEKSRQAKEYRKKNREELCLKTKIYTAKTKDKKKEYDRKNKNKINEKRRNYRLKKYRNDLIFRLSHNVGSVVRAYLKKNNGSKNNSSTWKALLFTPQDLKEHLEKLWEFWMNWENYGSINGDKRTWQIDHIIPQILLPYDSFEHPNFLKCWALENLRPLETSENIKKGDKVVENIG